MDLLDDDVYFDCESNTPTPRKNARGQTCIQLSTPSNAKVKSYYSNNVRSLIGPPKFYLSPALKNSSCKVSQFKELFEVKSSNMAKESTSVSLSKPSCCSSKNNQEFLPISMIMNRQSLRLVNTPIKPVRMLRKMYSPNQEIN